MVKNIKEIEPGRYRETFGRYYEEFNIGDIYEHRPGRTITQSDNTWFTLLTMNQHPIHFDEEFGKGTEFGKTLVNSPFTIALMVGMSVSDVSQKAIANLGWTDIVYLTLYTLGILYMLNLKSWRKENQNPDLMTAL